MDGRPHPVSKCVLAGSPLCLLWRSGPCEAVLVVAIQETVSPSVAFPSAIRLSLAYYYLNIRDAKVGVPALRQGEAAPSSTWKANSYSTYASFTGTWASSSASKGGKCTSTNIPHWKWEARRLVTPIRENEWNGTVHGLADTIGRPRKQA